MKARIFTGMAKVSLQRPHGRRPSRGAVAILLAVLLLLGPAWADNPDDPFKQPTPSPTATPAATPEKPEPVYAPYLKDPASLGFSPDNVLFDLVYMQIKLAHVEEDPDARLFEGVATEVKALLKEAKVPSTEVAALKRDRTMLDEVIRLYSPRVDKRVLWFAMVRGLFDGTEDRHSVLMTPREFRSLKEILQQSFGGVGIFVELDKKHANQLTVVEPVEGSPAFKAGVHAGDQITAIDGKSTAGISIDGASTLLRGKIGTRVVLSLRRGKQVLDVAIERADIQVPSVKSKMLAGNVGYIKLRVYGDKTSTEFAEALAHLERDGAKSLIIDVRNNGGGYLNAAVDVCSHFIGSGEVVTYITYKKGTRSNYQSADQPKAPRSRLPVVLLVNNFSASASEITAGCLKDYGVATIIGVKTFGKGSVQKVYRLPEGAAFKLTIAYFFTPHGNKINKVGVEPDVKIDMEPRLVGHDDEDVQLKKALEFLQKKTSRT